MSIWDIFRTGKSFKATDRETQSEIYGTDNFSGEAVTSHSALQLSAWWACVRLLSQTIATLPIGVFERRPNGEKIARPDHPLYRLLHDSPNADQTAVEFWEGRVFGLCTSGNGYAEKMYSGKRLVSLEHMPADTAVKRLPDGSCEYTYYDRGKLIDLPEDKVFHIRAFGSGENCIGLSPVSHARQTLGLALATDRAAGQTYSKGMRSKGFFMAPQLLTPEQRTQAEKTLVKPFSGPSGKDWGVLEGGFDFKTVNISPKDAELILSRKFNVEDICRWLDVPPVLIGHASEGQTMWGSGIEQIMLAWLTLGLRPYLTRIEQAIKKRLIEPQERDTIFAEFNIEGLLRGDSAARAALYSSATNNGWMKPNEIRSKENLPHEEGGDRLFINSSLVPMDQAGDGGADQQVKAAFRAWLGMPEEQRATEKKQ